MKMCHFTVWEAVLRTLDLYRSSAVIFDFHDFWIGTTFTIQLWEGAVMFS